VLLGRGGSGTALLEAAGVDPSTYDREHPPAGLGEDERSLIDAAAAVCGTLLQV